MRGTARGVTVIDDFGHHPTAIRETLGALRHRFPGHRLWAVFEPRSNTTRRAVFQQELPAALALADGVFLAQIAALEQIPEDIVERIVPLLQPNDVVTIFSNGGFDGIHEKLLAALRAGRDI